VAKEGVADSSLPADPVPQGIYEFDLHPIRVAPVELVEVFVAWVPSMFRSNLFYVPCLQLSIATETKLRQQSEERKIDYQG
jgi:hypothetical protein